MSFDLTDLVLQIPFGVGAGTVPSSPIVEFVEDPVDTFTEQVIDRGAAEFVPNDDPSWIDSKHMSGEVNYIDYVENWADQAAEQLQSASVTLYPRPVSVADYDYIGPTEFFAYDNNSNNSNNSNYSNYSNDSNYIDVIADYLDGNISSSVNNNNNDIEYQDNGLVWFGSNQNLMEGESGNDFLTGNNDDDIEYQVNDFVMGGTGQNIMDGARGNDFLIGNNSGDFIRGGVGHDVLLGGEGSDWLWGGSGQNILDPGINDGSEDLIFVYSDKHLNPRGNPDGNKRDLLVNIEELDTIYIHGVDDSTLSFVEGITDPAGTGLQGVAIYAEDSLEAFVTGVYTAEQINSITVGGIF